MEFTDEDHHGDERYFTFTAKKNANNTFAILFVTVSPAHGEDFSKQIKDESVDRETVDDIEITLYKRIRKNLSAVGIGMGKWYGVTFVELSGMTTLRTTYVELHGSDELYVDSYEFGKNYMKYCIEISYDMKGRTFWEALFKEVLSSINIR